MAVILYVIATILILLGAAGINFRSWSLAWVGVALFVFTFGVWPEF